MGREPAHPTGKWYAARNEKGRCILMHRQIMCAPKGIVVDHIHGDGLDNRKRYMRNCTPEQNSYNRPPWRGNVGFKGVRYNEQTGKYEARIGSGNKSTKLGDFDDPIEAAKARDRKARELQGE